MDFDYTFADGESGQFKVEREIYNAVMNENQEAIEILRSHFDQSLCNESTTTEPGT